jgi:hypothetical protein
MTEPISPAREGSGEYSDFDVIAGFGNGAQGELIHAQIGEGDRSLLRRNCGATTGCGA